MKKILLIVIVAFCLAISGVLTKIFGITIGLGFLLLSCVAIFTAHYVFRKILIDSRENLRKDIERMLAGKTMCEYLKDNPEYLEELRSFNESTHLALYEVLDPEDAKGVRQLLEPIVVDIKKESA